jgi:hypothetical protein
MMYLPAAAPILIAYLAFAQQPAQDSISLPAETPEVTVTLAPPVLLQADGAPISTGPYNGHSGPLVADYDGDGKQDLLVGNYKGFIQLYGNVGSKTEPKFESKGLLQAQGKDFYVKNW